MLFKRKNIPIEEKKLKSNEICKRFIDYIDDKKIECIYGYASSTDEVDTKNIINYCLLRGIKVFLPKVTDALSGKMEFYQINDLDKDLSQGFFGILEPVSLDLCNNIKPDLIVVPGVAFDLNLNRIGYGKGFYDRYIGEKIDDSTKLVALSFEEQILIDDYIKADSNDVKMDIIITESRVIGNE